MFLDTVKEEEVKPELRIVCKPKDKVADGFHKHQCPLCKTTWKHDGKALQDNCTSEEFAQAHDCPKCGENVRMKFYAKGEQDETFESFMKRLERLASIICER